jgi:hypothetical protein
MKWERSMKGDKKELAALRTVYSGSECLNFRWETGLKYKKNPNKSNVSGSLNLLNGKLVVITINVIGNISVTQLL